MRVIRICPWALHLFLHVSVGAFSALKQEKHWTHGWNGTVMIGAKRQSNDTCPNDCDQQCFEEVDDGPLRWRRANANNTLKCFIDAYGQNPYFLGSTHTFDQTLAGYYDPGHLRDFSCGNMGDSCTYSGNCSSLSPIAVQKPNGNHTLGYTCDPEDHTLLHKSTGEVVIQSLVHVHRYMRLVYDVWEIAIRSVSATLSDNDRFMNDFAEPEKADEDAGKGVNIIETLVQIAVASAGLITEHPAILGSGNIAGSLVSAILGQKISKNTEKSLPDLPGWFSHVTSNIEQSAHNFSTSLFEGGQVQLPPIGGKAPRNLTLLELISTGAFADKGFPFGRYRKEYVPVLKQSIYANLMLKLWSMDNAWPFILLWPGDCTKEELTPYYNFRGIKTPYPEISMHYQNACWSLIGAEYHKNSCPTEKWEEMFSPVPSCWTIKAFKGATRKTLTGEEKPYSWLKLDDIIVSSIDYWLQNDRINVNLTMADLGLYDRPRESLNFRNAGLFALPICDYAKDIVNPGLNCPPMFHRCPRESGEFSITMFNCSDLDHFVK